MKFREIQLFWLNLTDFINYNKPQFPVYISRELRNSRILKATRRGEVSLLREVQLLRFILESKRSENIERIEKAF